MNAPVYRVLNPRDDSTSRDAGGPVASATPNSFQRRHGYFNDLVLPIIAVMHRLLRNNILKYLMPGLSVLLSALDAAPR